MTDEEVNEKMTVRLITLGIAVSYIECLDTGKLIMFRFRSKELVNFIRFEDVFGYELAMCHYDQITKSHVHTMVFVK